MGGGGKYGMEMKESLSGSRLPSKVSPWSSCKRRRRVIASPKSPSIRALMTFTRSKSMGAFSLALATHWRQKGKKGLLSIALLSFCRCTIMSTLLPQS